MKAAFIKSDVKMLHSSRRSKKNKARRGQNKRTKQKAMFHSIPSSPTLLHALLLDNITPALFVDGGNPNNSSIQPVIHDKKKSRPIIIVPITDLHILLSHLSDSTKGLQRQDHGEVTNITIAPRTAALTHTSTAKNIEASTSLCVMLLMPLKKHPSISGEGWNKTRHKG